MRTSHVAIYQVGRGEVGSLTRFRGHLFWGDDVTWGGVLDACSQAGGVSSSCS